MTVVIVDDEKLAIEELVFQLSLCEDVHILATFMDPDIAEEFILNNHVDLVFLDIQMPGNNGIKFVTAHTEYAVHSYEINATDYLLKPISNTRLMKALDKVHQRKKQMLADQNIKPFSRLLLSNSRLNTSCFFNFL
ncbi:LytR/AlgR family response regulator transcription factor [Fusibacter tunisiensis]|uniref:Stage 0 sporulation protein A homolog n=1 Tax=Fusibacter tunisiensis TaxID=1008308 RepID=A0ABS2MP56_9FIRM|nr:response regulator [Fusibacter tunisiensis]MBM7561177.1 DNA-binding LytR/AlgR family response regulator [Fusibacter tunisiensis]